MALEQGRASTEPDEVEVADAAELALDGGEPAAQAGARADSEITVEAVGEGNRDLVAEPEYLNATDANAPTCEENEEAVAPEQ